MPTIVVSGAASGLGAAFVAAYRQDHSNTVIAIDRQEIGQLSGDVKTYAVDVSSQESVDEFAASLGDMPIDLVIHSAGIRGLVSRIEKGAAGDIDACENLEAMDLETMMRVNAAGTFMFLRTLLPNLRRTAGKAVIISSRMGSAGNNQRMNRAAGSGYAYRASKAAVNAIVRSFAVDVPEVTFVLCHPGRVESRLVPWVEDGAISPQDSIRDILPLIAKWNLTDSGKFYDRFGEVIEW